jgi:hypothetical protein
MADEIELIYEFSGDGEIHQIPGDSGLDCKDDAEKIVAGLMQRPSR